MSPVVADALAGAWVSVIALVAWAGTVGIALALHDRCNAGELLFPWVLVCVLPGWTRAILARSSAGIAWVVVPFAAFATSVATRVAVGLAPAACRWDDAEQLRSFVGLALLTMSPLAGTLGVFEGVAAAVAGGAMRGLVAWWLVIVWTVAGGLALHGVTCATLGCEAHPVRVAACLALAVAIQGGGAAAAVTARRALDRIRPDA